MGGGLVIRRKRLLRLHLEGMNESIEGIYVGVWAGHYVLRAASVLQGPDESRSLEGTVRVPKTRVLFAQELTR